MWLMCSLCKNEYSNLKLAEAAVGRGISKVGVIISVHREGALSSGSLN
jgi:hypothetical protein